MRHDLTRLGAQEFENLSQALALAALGPGVSVFGEGPDGGREATFDGLAQYPDPVPAAGRWDGYCVIQAKFMGGSPTTATGTTWFLGQVRAELDKWKDDGGRRRRGRRPQYLLFTTNVTLSADPVRGGIDRFDAALTTAAAAIGLRGWDVWHHDRICRLLDVHGDVRRTYAAFITVGDVLVEAHHALAALRFDQVHEEPLESLLTRRAATELLDQQWVRLGEAGDPGNQRLQLSDVAVDLPARPQLADGPDRVPGVVSHVVGAADTVRRPRAGEARPTHLALVGGPGQGKTTLGQLICQAYRTAILAQRPPHLLSHEVVPLVAAYRSHLTRLGVPTPTCLRWPVRVVLSEFADALAEERGLTLLHYVARQNQAVSPINPTMMREWLREWPWLLVLDGLDEVADPSTRQQVREALSAFYVEAAQLNADLLIVATTRPQGYGDEFPRDVYEHFELEVMEPAQALAYAGHLTRVRFTDDREMRERVLGRLRVAADDPHTRRLMSTPLQVTIMSVLLERRATAPRERHGLFEAFYNTLYEREIGKGTSVSRLLDDYREEVVDVLHERVGLRLQSRAQEAGEADARLPRTELHEIVLERLAEEEHPTATAERLARDIAKAATDRLVLLVGGPNDTVGFEVRSFQELMAARALFAAGAEGLVARLERIGFSAHWRNTWLFAAGRLFATRQELRPHVLTMLGLLDTAGPLASRLLPGARLAVELLEEDVTATQPKFRRLLLERALNLVSTSYPGPTMTSLARVVNDSLGQQGDLLHQVRPRLDALLHGRERDRLAALDFLAAWSQLPDDTAVPARSRIERILAGTPPLHLDRAVQQLRAWRGRPTWSARGPQPLNPADAEQPGAVLRGLLATARENAAPARAAAIDLLRDGAVEAPFGADAEIQQELVDLMDELEGSHWTAAAQLEANLLHRLQRATVSENELAQPEA